MTVSPQKLLALHIPADTHHDVVDRTIAEVFGAPSSSATFGCDRTFTYFDIIREGEVLRHVHSQCEVTVASLATLLRPHCAFVRDASVEWNPTERKFQ